MIHGGLDPILRKESALFLRDRPFDGYAIGGSLGKTKEDMLDMLKELMPHLPLEKPSHLLGIGDLPSIDKGVLLGIDTFDSSYPTKAARHGILLTEEGPLNITKTSYANTFTPIHTECPCPTCQKYHIAYLHHLFKAKEIPFQTLATIHNLHFMVRLMGNYRQKILNDLI